MKKCILCFMTVILFVTSLFSLPVNALEKGNIVAEYWEGTISKEGKEFAINESDPLLFLNGSIVTDYKVIIKKGTSLVPLRLISEGLGCSVSWNGKQSKITIKKGTKNMVLSLNKKTAYVNGKAIKLEYPAILHQNSTYVPLRFIAEQFDSNVSYYKGFPKNPKYYYETKMPVTPAGTLLRGYSNIIIDEPYDFKHSPSKEEAMKQAKELCLKGLEQFEKTTREQTGNSDHLDSDFDAIRKEINRMMYIGEVSRYYQFTIGPYDILFDRINQKMYFIVYSSSTIVKEIDVYDKALYTYIFLVG